MPDEKQPKKPAPRKIGDLIEGINAVKNPGYAAYKREAEAMGDEVLTPEQWAAQQKRNK